MGRDGRLVLPAADVEFAPLVVRESNSGREFEFDRFRHEDGRSCPFLRMERQLS